MRARLKESCGDCRADIAKGAVLMEIRIAGRRRFRCAACAEAAFGEPAPTSVADDEPSIVAIAERKPDFVTTSELASRTRRDFRQRQVGEHE
jgi:hypothetical protein